MSPPVAPTRHGTSQLRVGKVSIGREARPR
jgi:hypothetical protein